MLSSLRTQHTGRAGGKCKAFRGMSVTALTRINSAGWASPRGAGAYIAKDDPQPQELAAFGFVMRKLEPIISVT